MKVNAPPVTKLFENIQQKQSADVAEKKPGAGTADKVNFSKELQHLQAKEDALSVDSNRQARIESVKQEIADGTYAPDSHKVASSIVKYVVEGSGHE